MLKTEKEVWDLIGRDTILEFRFLSDKIATFETAIPKVINGSYKTYELEFFVNDKPAFFIHESYNDFLSRFQVLSVKEFSKERSEERYLSHYKG